MLASCALDRLKHLEHPEIGEWSVLKNEIIDQYTQAYLTIMNAQPWCRGTLYVDAFAGATLNRNRKTQELVPGSAKRALEKELKFSEYYFVDTNPIRVEGLKSLAEGNPNVRVFHQDGNRILLDTVIPRLQFQERRRGFVLLDPYGLQLEWQVVRSLGQTRSADVAINFPTMDINRNSARREQAAIDEANAARMTKWWGDESWIERFYGPGPKWLHGESGNRKIVNNADIVGIYRQRLLDEGSFDFVTDPLPMKNSQNAVLYYILMASNNETAVHIMNQVLDKYRKPRNLSLF